MNNPAIYLALSGLMLIAGCRSPASPAPVGGSSGQGQSLPTPQADTATAYDLIAEKKYAEAEPLLKRAIDTDPLYGPARNDLGLVYYRTDRLYQAATEFEQAARLMPHAPQPRNNLGLVLERAGRLADALAHYTEASQLDPDNADYLGNLARARVRLGLNDPETRKALGDLLLKDNRPAWRHWARFTLLRLQAASSETEPSTLPAN